MFTFDQDVREAVNGVRKGLEDEGMADLASSVKVADAAGGAKRITRREIILRREAFARVPTIFLPRVLHRDDGTVAGFRLLDYDRDILGELDWSGFRFLQAGSLAIEDVEKLKRTIARVDLDKKTDETGLFTHELVAEVPDEGLDLPFLVRQLLDVIPNPWQGMRILDETLATLRSRGVSEQRLFVNRLALVQAMKVDLKRQVNLAAERLFREKLKPAPSPCAWLHPPTPR